MKNILFSTTHFNTVENGPAFFANLLYKKISAHKNYDLRFVSEDLNKNQVKSDNFYKLQLKKNKLNSFFYQFFRIRQYHKKAADICKTFPFDILVYNNAFTGWLSTKKMKQPVLVMINDYNRMELMEKSFYFSKNYFKNLLLFYLEKSAAKVSTHVIVNSKFLKSTIQNMYSISATKISVLYKGIELKKYDFRLRKEFNEEIRILFVKGGYVNGGFYELVEAIKTLKKYSITLTIIGPRHIDLPHIKSYLKEKNIKNYELNGPLHPDKVKEYFDAADIFCVPSHKEALGVANMEALASGIPVVSTNVGGIPEVLDYGKCGWLVEPNNPMQLANALQECIENTELRLEKSNAGYAHVQQFNSEKLVENFLHIVDKVIDQDEKK